MFRIGQKVVCVNAGEPRWAKRRPKDAPPLHKGAIYTVSGRGRDGNGDRIIFLDELPAEGRTWIGYDPERFRPVVERKTDIGIFQEIARKASKPKRVPQHS